MIVEIPRDIVGTGPYDVNVGQSSLPEHQQYQVHFRMPTNKELTRGQTNLAVPAEVAHSMVCQNYTQFRGRDHQPVQGLNIVLKSAEIFRICCMKIK